MKPDAPAARRNRDVILSVLKRELAAATRLLEIGSGSGQHAVYFAHHLPHLHWQPSDVAANLDGINLWIDDAELGNLARAIELDVASPRVNGTRYDAVFSANTAHIMSTGNVRKMIDLVCGMAASQLRFLLYGPFRMQGEFTSESNRQFDESLRSRDASMGIRELEWLDELLSPGDFRRVRQYAMPANNLLLVWERGGAA